MPVNYVLGRNAGSTTWRKNWNSPRKVDSGLSFFRPFVLRRRDVPQRGVPPLGVVEDFNVLHDRRPRLRPRGEVRAVHQPLFESGEEALHGRVTPAVPLPAHATRDAVAGQQALVVLA